MANAIKPITYSLAKGEFKAPVVFNTEHLTIRLIIDFTEQGVDAWEKFLDLRTATGSERTIALGTGIVAEVLLESGDLESGITIIQPFAIDEPYARRDWPQRPLPVGAALGNTVNNTTLKQDLIDFFQHYLDDMDASMAIKSVTVTTLEPGEEATVSVIREADGTRYEFGIPQGQQGVPGYTPVKGTDYFDGEQGIPGLKGNQWRGAYSGATAYVVDDVVSYLGSSYICILASTNNLPTNVTYWSLFAQKGDNTSATNVTNTPSGGISATDVQSAINELDTEKANKAQEAWITATLVNGWVRFSESLATSQYMKDEMGFVHLRGIVKSGITPAIYILPTGYRPGASVYISTVSNGLFAYLVIGLNGVVTANSYSNAWISLENIVFKAEL